MMNPKSIYALNKKDPDAIVYTDAGKHIIRLTREDFDTEADFLKWKAWSDEDYHDEEKGDHVQANHVTSLTDLPDGAATSEGPEIIVEHRFEKMEHDRYSAETIIHIRGQLTDKQFRRFWMHSIDGLSEKEIARLERVTPGRISESLKSASKKIMRLFRIRQISDRI